MWKNLIFQHNFKRCFFFEIDKKNNDCFFKILYFCHVFNDNFIFRFYWLFILSLNEKRAWKNLINCLNNNNKIHYFRLNIFIFTKKIVIDNINYMKKLKKNVQLFFHNLKNWINAIFVLLIINFYFELQIISRFENKNYTCHNTIQCRNNINETLTFFEIYHDNQKQFF